jgi:hypothetical protein
MSKHICKIAEQTPNERGEYGFAYCEICKRMMDWYCPNSPDHQCYYSSENGMAIGTDFPVPANNEFEDGYSCIFCGEPDERK